MTQLRDAVLALGGQPFGNPAVGLALLNDTWFVSTDGRDRMTYGKQKWSPLATIQAAIDAAYPGDLILVAPGTYDESLVIDKDDLTIVGLGGYGSVIVAPSTADPAALVTASNVTLINLDLTGGTGATYGTEVQGDNFHAVHCKFEMQDNLVIALNLIAATGAPVGHSASLFKIEECEFAWAATGIQFNLETSACTQGRISRCRFHNLSASSLGEGVTGGCVRNLIVEDCTFDRMEDGSEPAAYISLNVTACNTNSGIVSRCSFPTAIDGGKNVVSTKLLWAANFHTGGMSGAQPS